MNRWALTEEARNEYKPIVEAHIQNIEEDVADGKNAWDSYLDLTDTKLNPFTLGTILEELEYSCTNQDNNGWQLDFWITYEKSGSSILKVCGTGILCEFGLRGDDE